MNTWFSFITGIIVSLVVSTTIVFSLAKPLRSILQEMCETERQGHFWGTFTNIVLYLTPLLSTVLFGAIGEDRAVSTAELIRSLLASSLAGAFLAVLSMGLIIMKNTRNVNITPSSRKSYSEEFWEETKDK
jgi:hypothetical protein